MNGWVIFGNIVRILIAWVILANLRDLRRYFTIRSMQAAALARGRPAAAM